MWKKFLLEVLKGLCTECRVGVFCIGTFSLVPGVKGVFYPIKGGLFLYAPIKGTERIFRDWNLSTIECTLMSLFILHLGLATIFLCLSDAFWNPKILGKFRHSFKALLIRSTFQMRLLIFYLGRLYWKSYFSLKKEILFENYRRNFWNYFPIQNTSSNFSCFNFICPVITRNTSSSL